MAIPKHDQLFNPLLQALHRLGYSASIAEQEDEVAKILGLSEKDTSIIHKGNTTKFSYNLAWARSYLKLYGLIDNSSRGIWALTTIGKSVAEVDPIEVKRVATAQDRKTKKKEEKEVDQLELKELKWEDEALDVIKSIQPDAFERLCQRILRESGFTQVEVTGRSGDGGIDGNGVVKLGGILSFHVFFQCKRYKGSVASSVIRDFRGAMVGRADKGLLITTGSFTRDARKEASRDGAPPLDLMDGHDLVKKLKELSLGIYTKEKVIEEVTVDAEWFKEI